MFVYSIYMVLADKHQKRKLKKNPKVINENYKPFVTIMVPAHNEASVIAAIVENILQLDYPNYELIIIDDRSEDNTAEVLRNLENKHANVKAFIREKDAFPGKSAVLNDAMQFAKGEAILVFDADAINNIAEDNDLKQLVKLSENKIADTVISYLKEGKKIKEEQDVYH